YRYCRRWRAFEPADVVPAPLDRGNSKEETKWVVAHSPLPLVEGGAKRRVRVSKFAPIQTLTRRALRRVRLSQGERLLVPLSCALSWSLFQWPPQPRNPFKSRKAGKSLRRSVRRATRPSSG